MQQPEAFPRRRTIGWVLRRLKPSLPVHYESQAYKNNRTSGTWKTRVEELMSEKILQTAKETYRWKR